MEHPVKPPHGKARRMVRQTYTGITNPRAEFERLRPFRNELIRMKTQLRPFGPDYLILEALDKALTTAAYHFTREPDFYSFKPPSA
jgi:hypothetical protein